ncbi:hypothetical protein RvY_17242 [Ramazzottius varieornatus]|uniref:Uncharacterized protein n=1 Tax=Ramazzottius varieornatus TaxID=947166 RepID=A0A1D1W1F6_RAMVA|nr:hypothetical protein RvY_17242 [Ramazzottius varieornatus]
MATNISVLKWYLENQAYIFKLFNGRGILRVHVEVAAVTKEIPSMPQGSLKDAIKEIVKQDTDDFIDTDTLVSPGSNN